MKHKNVGKVSLDDLLPPGDVDLSDLIDEEPRGLSSYKEPTKVVLHWNRYTCKCGSVYRGPDYCGKGAVLATPTTRGKALEYTPLIDPRLHPDLPRIVEYHDVGITTCPGCLELERTIALRLLLIYALPEMLMANRLLENHSPVPEEGSGYGTVYGRLSVQSTEGETT